MKLLTSLILSLSLVSLAWAKPPVLNDEDIVSVAPAMCPDGSRSIVMVLYEKDSNKHILYVDGDKKMADLDLDKKEVYVFAEDKVYSLDQIKLKYPSPCDIPLGDPV